MELKSSTSEDDYFTAVEELQNEYEAKIPEIFVSGLINVAADSSDLRYASVGAGTTHYYPWNEEPYEEPLTLKETVKSLMKPEKIFDILKNFVIYKDTSEGHAKITPRYMQYNASKKLLDRIGGREVDKGLIWHTQGSGKSLTMLYTAKNLINRDILDNPQVLVLVDRKKLENQMDKELKSIDFDQFDTAQNGEHLQELLSSGKSTLILTTIHKFKSVRNNSQGNPDTIVLTDEAHRFMEEDLGSKLDAVLPDCMHFGFTGTPVQDSNRDTFGHYSGNGERYMDHYSIKQGMKDEFILPVCFDERSGQISDYDKEEIDKEFEREVQAMTDEDKSEAIKKSVTKDDIDKLRPRIEEVADNISSHFQYVKKNGYKGMVVAPNRPAAAIYGDILQEKLGEEEVKVLISEKGKDTELTKKFKTSDKERKDIVEDVHEEENPKLIVVVRMLLTGFDEPDLKTIYLDEDLANHNLLQAIARTNRIKDNKNNGEIVDYRGVFDEVDKALQYSEDLRNSAAIDKEKLLTGDEQNDIKGFKPLLEEIISIFDGIEKKDSTETLQKAKTRLRKNPEKKKKFLEGMRKLQDLYESISPDARLKEQDIEVRYKWLTKLKLAFDADKTDKSKKRQREKIREKTQEILEDHVDVEEIDEEFGTYRLNEKHLEDMDNLEPSVKATKVSTAVKNHLTLHQGENPDYRKLSERLEEVLERWQKDDISDEKAVKELEDVEEDTKKVEQKAEKQGFTDYEYAFYRALIQDYGDFVEDQEAKEIAKNLGKKFREDVDTSFNNWQRNDTVRDEFNKALLEVLVKDFDKIDLYKHHTTSLKEDLWMYVVENTS
jgi:type I restriction enzyme R subunit